VQAFSQTLLIVNCIVTLALYYNNARNSNNLLSIVSK